MSSRIVSAEATVLAPPDVVFAILADPRQHTRIDGSGTVRRVWGPARLVRGSEFGADMRLVGLPLPYKIPNRVVEFEEGRLIAWRHFGGHRWRYQLEPVGEGTRVTESFDYSMYPRLHRLVIELAGYPTRNRRAIEQTLVRLKAAAEADAASTQHRDSGTETRERRVILRKGSRVSWTWGSGTATGKIVEVHRAKVTRTIKGSEITRNGTQDDPAYLIEQDDGSQVLKSRSEVERA